MEGQGQGQGQRETASRRDSDSDVCHCRHDAEEKRVPCWNTAPDLNITAFCKYSSGVLNTHAVKPMHSTYS